MAIAAGSRFDRYEILSPLGKGGMGEVYLAHDTRLGRKIALKLLPVEFTQDEDRLRRFEQEARAASALNHPNIITIYEIGEVDGTHFIAAEFIEGQTLRQPMTSARMEIAAALDVAAQVASALAAAHTANIVHRDIKPENVMLRPDGLVKVLDFGLAKLTEPQTSVDTEAPTSAGVNTETGMVMGTVRYMSPEQARGLKVDARTDLFSLGVLLYEMIAGKSPFEGATTGDVIAAILKTEPPPLKRYVAEAPEALEWIMTKALTKDREERYQTAKELLTDLKRLKRRLEIQAELERTSGGEWRKDEGESRSGERSQSLPASASRFDPSAFAPAAAHTTSSAEYLISEIKRHKRGLMVALAALIVGAIALVYLAPWARQRPQGDQPLPQRKLSRLTFDPGLQSEPTWSPDGRLIAYSSDRSGNFDIWVQPVSEGKPVQVTTAPAHDWQPDWSPDGNRLVFRSEREGGGLFVVPVLGGNERKISSFGYRPRWSPDGSQILFLSSILSTIAAPKVYVVALDGKPPREVLAGFLAEFTGQRNGLRVAWHPDGQRVSLWGEHRKLGLGFWTVPMTGGAPVKWDTTTVGKQLTEASVVLSDFLWATSGRTLYFEGTSQGVRNLWKVGVDPQTLRWISGPERLTTGPGLDTNIALSPDGKRLAFTTRTESNRAWSLTFNAATGQTKGAAQPVTAAGVEVRLFNLSRDGKKLAFVARQAGKVELRAKSLEDGQETLLVAADDFFRTAPSWSPDDLHLAYRRSRINPERTQTEFSLVLLPAGGGDEQMLASPVTSNETPWDWSADGQWIVVSTSRLTPGRQQICLFPVSAAPHAETQMRVVASHPEYNLWQPRFSPDQRWITFNAEKATEAGASTIYVVAASGGEWKRITEGKHWDDKPRWSPDGKTLYFISDRTGFINVWGIRFDSLSGKPVGEPFRVTAFESPSQMIPLLVSGYEISLAANRLILPIMEVSGGIWILENVDR